MPRQLDTTDELVKACTAYFEWADRNTLKELQLFSTAKQGIVAGVKPHQRAYTLQGLLVHLGISHQSWANWRNSSHPKYRGDLAEVIEQVEPSSTSRSSQARRSVSSTPA
jgi:hypothetical protein